MPIIIWSFNNIFCNFPIFINSIVLISSVLDGLGSPLGWLCTQINECALSRWAFLNISLTSIIHSFKLPINNNLVSIIVDLVSKYIT